MIASRVVARVAPAVRNISTSAVRASDHGHSGANAPGAALPFSIKNRYALAVKFVIYFGTGLGVPFYCARYHMLKGH